MSAPKECRVSVSPKEYQLVSVLNFKYRYCRYAVFAFQVEPVAGIVLKNQTVMLLVRFMDSKYILYFDDTGSRDPDKQDYTTSERRQDEMDCFGLGGTLIKEEDVIRLIEKHAAFCAAWNIDYPLQSSRIRGGQGKFGWLRKPENAGLFLPALQDFLLDLPIVGAACIINRPGYVARYRHRYNERLWLMCKTAFSILVERAAKFADDQGRKLEICFEESGKKEDRAIIQYMRDLKRQGNPFDRQTSGVYEPLSPEDYRRIVLGEPRRKTKKVPMIQIADLVLYPMAKGGYDPSYPPYKRLLEGNKLIDCFFSREEAALRGIKYSCFDEKN